MVKLVRESDNRNMNRRLENQYLRLLRAVAANIKSARQNKGLTQEDMMDHGFNYRFYQKLESGKYSMTLKTLHKVACALSVAPGDLLRED